MRTMEQMKDNAQRQLDGMTSNRDQMARDILFLADAVAQMQERQKQMERMQSIWESMTAAGAAAKDRREENLRKVFGNAWFEMQKSRGQA